MHKEKAHFIDSFCRPLFLLRNEVLKFQSEKKELTRKKTSFIIVYVLMYGTVHVVWVENK